VTARGSKNKRAINKSNQPNHCIHGLVVIWYLLLKRRMRSKQ